MILKDLKNFLEKIDRYRDKVFFIFIKPYWPRRISPNQLSYARVVIAIAMFVLLFFFGIINRVLILSLFCLGILTDLLDGSVSRCLNEETEFGAMLDPLADRLLVLPIAVYSLYGSHRVLLLVLLLAEVINAVAAIFYKSRESYSRANVFGKTKMVLFSFVLIVILIVWPHEPPVFFIDILWVSLIFTALSLFTGLMELKNKGHIKSKIINEQLSKFKDENL